MRLHYLIGVSALAMAPTMAYAQSNPEEQGASSQGVPEIIVTAQRRAQNLQEAPVAVTALSPAILEERNISTTQDLMQVAPGLQISTQTAGNSGGSATFFLRGLGQQRSGNGSEPAVGIYVDDIYYPALQGTLFNIVDLAQVEVLRGPQGTLFGRNTIGGAIRYTTKRPSYDLEAQITGTYGSYDRTDIQGSVNVPLGNILALRLTAGHLKRDGFVKRADGTADAGATETNLVRGQIRIDPTANLNIELSGQLSRDELEGFPYTMPGPIVPKPATLPFVYNLLFGATAPYDNRYSSACSFCQTGPGDREYNVNKITSASSAVTWQANDKLTIKSLTGYTRVHANGGIDYDGSERDIIYGVQNTYSRAFSQELQFNATLLNDRLNAVAGLFYYDDTYNDTNLSITFGTPGLYLDVTRDTKSYAVFGDFSFALTDKLSLLFGGRYSKDKKKAFAYRTTGALIDSASKSFASTTGRVGLKYQWNDDIMTYASISDGFRAGGFNYVNQVSRLFSFEPEKLRSYEVGARMELFDRRLRLNPTFFYAKYRDIQLQATQYDPVSLTNLILFQNAGKAHTYGFELEGQLALTDELQIFGNLATLHAEFDSIGSATDITLNTKFQRAPKLTWALGASYTKEVKDYKIGATVNYSWQDKQSSVPNDTGNLILPSYGLLSARLQITDSGEHFTVAIFGTNLTDKVSYIGGVGYSNNVGADRYDLGRPREFGVSFKAKY